MDRLFARNRTLVAFTLELVATYRGSISIYDLLPKNTINFKSYLTIELLNSEDAVLDSKLVYSNKNIYKENNIFFTY